MLNKGPFWKRNLFDFWHLHLKWFFWTDVTFLKFHLPGAVCWCSRSVLKTSTKKRKILSGLIIKRFDATMWRSCELLLKIFRVSIIEVQLLNFNKNLPFRPETKQIWFSASLTRFAFLPLKFKFDAFSFLGLLTVSVCSFRYGRFRTGVVSTHVVHTEPACRQAASCTLLHSPAQFCTVDLQHTKFGSFDTVWREQSRRDRYTWSPKVQRFCRYANKFTEIFFLFHFENGVHCLELPENFG